MKLYTLMAALDDGYHFSVIRAKNKKSAREIMGDKLHLNKQGVKSIKVIRLKEDGKKGIVKDTFHVDRSQNQRFKERNVDGSGIQPLESIGREKINKGQ